MASFPKKPKSAQPKSGMPQAGLPANDPMLDAIRNGGEDEPHFGASPGAVQAANAVLMANIRSKLGTPSPGPAYAGPASAMPKMAAPTIELPTPPKAEAAKGAASNDASPVLAAALSAGASPATFGEEDTEETKAPDAAPEVSPSAKMTFTDASVAPVAESQEAAVEQAAEEDAAPATEASDAEAHAAEANGAETLADHAAPETTFTDMVADTADSLPASSDDTTEKDAGLLAAQEPPYHFGIDATEEEENFAVPLARVSPAAARQAVEVPFDATATTSERAARAFPHLAETEFHPAPEADVIEGMSAPAEDPYKHWHNAQSPRQRRLWRWMLAGLLVAGLGINVFLLRQTDTASRSVSPARLPVAAATPPAPVPPLAMESPPAAMAPASPAPVAPPAPMQTPARAAQPALAAPMTPQPPVAMRLAIDPQHVLRLLSRP